MKDFLDWLSVNWPVIPSCIAAVVSSIDLASRGRSVRRAIKKAKERETYIKCPHCGTVHKIKDLDFFLPSGEKDNDLNGIPDTIEKGD